MKKLLLLMAMFVVKSGFSQEDELYKKIDDEWFRAFGARGLKVGDTMPDIPLGAIINNNTGNQRFSNFRGRLLILDFWTTGCTVCIEGFPYMEELQKKFGDKIQILLVNSVETESQINKIFDQSNKKLPNLPSIVVDQKLVVSGRYKYDSSLLYRLFPFRNVPHHVWIDGSGKIRLIGGHESTYAEKISDLLEGKEISYLNSTAAVPDLSEDRNSTYYKLLGSLKKTRVNWGSFITPYNNEISGAQNEIIDSNNNSITSYFINEDLLTIYEKGPFIKKIQNQNRFIQILYLPFSMFDDLVIFPAGEDISKISSQDFLLNRRSTDKDYLTSKYCYEQIAPLHLTEEIRRQYMLEDLNRFSISHLGIFATWVKVNMPCYILVRTSANDKVSPPTKVPKLRRTSKAQVRETVEFNSAESLASIINYAIGKNPDLQLLMEHHKKSKTGPFLILNETGWEIDKMVKMTLPIATLRTMEDLRNALKPYDLDILEEIKEIECIVFKKVK